MRAGIVLCSEVHGKSSHLFHKVMRGDYVL